MKKKLIEQSLLNIEELGQRVAPGLIIDELVQTVVEPCISPAGVEEPPKGEEPPKDEEPTSGNNGWGNGEDPAPGSSAEAQPEFEDPYTGESPSSSPESADGDR